MFTGNVSTGYQRSSRNFSLGSGGNLASLGSQTSTAQMIPTPGFANNGTNNNSDGFSGDSVNDGVGVNEKSVDTGNS